MVRRIAVWTLFAVAGCFGDPPPAGGTNASDASTGGGGCTPGEALCACRPGDECDAGLECTPNGCVSVDCAPGLPNCPCATTGDACPPGWTCDGGFCVIEGSTSGMTSTTSPSMTSDATQSITTHEVTSVMGSGSGIADTTSQPMTTAADDLMTSDTGLACNTFDTCDQCAFCSLSVDCEEPYTTCQNAGEGCTGPLMCVNLCLQMTEGIPACIASCGCEGNDALRVLVDCVEIACGGVCNDDLPCSTPG